MTSGLLDPGAASDGSTPPSEPDRLDGIEDLDRRRFTKVACIALAIALVPYLWLLWGGDLDPLHHHPSGVFSNFYDLQARALFDGHWWLPRGSIGIEGFVYRGHTYTYFGPFPAFLRMPVLALTSDLDGELTAPSMLLSWLVTGLFVPLLLWRIRVLLRGRAPLTRSELVSYGVVITTIMSGSVLLYLGSLPWVFNEAFAWGVAFSVGAFFALLGVLEQPSWRRVVLTGALTAGAVLSRATLGWGCAIACLLAAAWLAFGREGQERRGWAPWLVGAALVPVAAGSTVTYMKFHNLFVHPSTAQVWTRISAHRREVLDAHGGNLFGIDFIPSTVWAYTRPFGLRWSAVYPFLTMPARPPRSVDGAVIDQMWRSASMPASMPLLFFLAVWGVVVAFRPRTVGRARLLTMPLIGAAIGTTGVLMYAYIANRYLGDFMPLIVLGLAVGVVDVWRRLEGKRIRVRRVALGVVAFLGCFGVLANIGIAVDASGLAWDQNQFRTYIDAQKSISDATGHPLDSRVEHGPRLPVSADAGEIFIVGDCDALFVSSGEDLYPRWLPYEFGPKLRRDVDITYAKKDQGRIPLVELRSAGHGTITVSMEDRGIVFRRWMRFRIDGPGIHRVSRWIRLKLDRSYPTSIVTDTSQRRIMIDRDGERVMNRRLPKWITPAATPRRAPGDPPAPVSLTARPTPPPSTCHELLDDVRR